MADSKDSRLSIDEILNVDRAIQEASRELKKAGCDPFFADLTSTPNENSGTIRYSFDRPLGLAIE